MRNILREERHKKGMTQKQVADLLGISERGYKFIEYGQRTGSIEIWDKLEDIFNVHQRLLRCNSVPKDSRS
jgi:transcriptional regulator with XRE-family HTH domain